MVARKPTRKVSVLNARKVTGHTLKMKKLNVPRHALLICILPSRTDGVWNVIPDGKAVVSTRIPAVNLNPSVIATGKITGRTLLAKTNVLMDTLDVVDGATSVPTTAMTAMASTPVTSALTTSD